MWSRFALATVLLAGCAVAYSGPLRTIPLETAETVLSGRVGVGVSGGAHAASIGHASGRVHVGVAPGLDLSAEGSWVGTARESMFGIGHAGIRHRIDTHVALTGGVGLGGGIWGLYGGPDLGVIVAYENPEIVPFLAARMTLSVPLLQTPTTTRTVSGMTTTTEVFPSTTLYLQPSGGLRIPVVLDRRAGTRLDLTVAVAWTHLVIFADPQTGGGTWGAELGLELVL